MVGCQTEERNLISFASGNIYVLCLYNSLTSVASHAVFQFQGFFGYSDATFVQHVVYVYDAWW